MSPGEVERGLEAALQALLEGIPWLRGWTWGRAENGWDIRVSGRMPGNRKAVLCVECKTASFQPSQFQSLVDRQCAAGRKAISIRILAMPRISARMAALCQAHEWSWYDLAGNCRLEIPGVLLIERSCRAPAKMPRRAGANLGTPEAASVVRALLAPENAGRRWTQREMVAHFADNAPAIRAPSLALVNKIVQHLRDQAFLTPLPNRGFRISDHVGLLKAWRDAYRFDRHTARSYFMLLHTRVLQERLRAFEPEAQGRLAFAVFSAAEVQAPAVRQPRMWLYVDPRLESDLQRALEAKPVDSGENLIVLLPGDEGVFYRPDSGKNRIACTNPAQTYVDLAHSRGRGDEAAEAILLQRLEPAWSAAR